MLSSKESFLLKPAEDLDNLDLERRIDEFDEIHGLSLAL